jgi:hypothetical protein
MDYAEEQLSILRRVENGDISIDYAVILLDALERRRDRAESQPEIMPDPIQPDAVIVPDRVQTEEPSPASTEAGIKQDQQASSRWKVWSKVAFGLAVVLTALGALWIAQGWMAQPWGVGFWLAWIPFWLGVFGMMVTYKARWLHIRIHQKEGESPENIVISMPFPIRLVRSMYPFISRWMPAEIKATDWSELLRDMEDGLTPENPLHIQVDDERSGQVEVFIG